MKREITGSPERTAPALRALSKWVVLFFAALPFAAAAAADAVAPAISPTVARDYGEPYTQSVTKTTDASEITIELHTAPPAASKRMAQASAKSTLEKQAPENAATKPAVSRAEQIGLFRIYRSNLLKLTYQHVVYPESAIDRNHQGDVIVTLIIQRDGKVQSVELRERAEFSSLNKAAKQAIDNAKKAFPPAPKRLIGESFEVTMPIKFRLSG